MFQPHLPETEITYRQYRLRTEYMRAQRQISIAGVRQILGNTVMEIGSRIHGMAQDSSEEATNQPAHVHGALCTSDPIEQATVTH